MSRTQGDRRNLEAERVVVGAALSDPEVYRDEYARGLRAHMFSDFGMNRVWQAIGTTIEAGEPAELLERVAAHLRDDAGLTVSDLARLQSDVPSTANASFYGNSVRTAFIHRELERLPELLSNEEDPGVRSPAMMLGQPSSSMIARVRAFALHARTLGRGGVRSGCTSGWDCTETTVESGGRRLLGKRSRPDRPHNP